MKWPILITITVVLYSFFSSCKKSSSSNLAPASIMVVNAMVGSNSIIPVFGKDTPRYFATSQTIGYGSSMLYSPIGGMYDVSIIQIPDTSDIMFRGNLDLKEGGIYSFFLLGESKSLDTLFIKDIITNYTDSSAGIRFINLRIGSQPMTVNLKGTYPSQSEFTSLGFKQFTGFKQYNGKKGAPTRYTFEIRDQTSGNILSTYNWTYTRGRNNTIVIAGVDGGSVTVFKLNHY